MAAFAPSKIKQAAALGSTAASLVMTVAKLIVGLMTGSIGILSEAAHSGLDLGATLITFFAVRVSDKPPDEDHPYGHGKIESVAALSETALLFLTSGWILWEAGHRLATGSSEVETNGWAIAVILGSMVIDATRARALSKVAKETRSQALEADALHFSSDILSSGVVLVGLGLVWLGYPMADSLAAIGVSLFVCLAGWRLGRRTIDTLIDTAPVGIAERVRQISRRAPGVVDVGRVRARPTGIDLQVDLEIGIGRAVTLERTAEIKRQLTEAIRAEIEEAEVSITTFAVTLDDESVRERILMAAANHGHAIHHVTVQHLGGRLAVSLDLEVDGRLSLAEAHDIATSLEQAIEATLGQEVEVETHIEPMLAGEIVGAEASADLVTEITDAIAVIAAETDGVIDTHDVRVRRSSRGLWIAFHCTFAPDRPVDFVHSAVSTIETRVRARWPNAYRILTHAEPPTRTTAARA